MLESSCMAFDWLERRNLISANKVAIIDLNRERRFSYREFNERANRLANGWREKWNIKKGDRIAILAGNCPEYLEAFYAAGKLGAILVAVNVRLAGEELMHIINNSKPEGIIVGLDFLNTIYDIRAKTNISNYIVVDEMTNGDMVGYDDFLESSDCGTVKPDFLISLDDPRIILYTSGTTGYPKGAIITNGNILFNAINVILQDDMVTSETTNLSCVPFFHIAGLNIMTNPTLYMGGTVVIMGAFDAEQIIKVIHERRVNSAFLIPTMWRFVCSHDHFKSADFSGMRIATTGGEPVPISVIQALKQKGVILTQGYGLTESGPSSIVQKREGASLKPGSSGIPTFHTEVRIVDELGGDAITGQTGEIILRGPTITPGYWNNPKGTKEAFRDGWFYTGDLGVMDDDGDIYIKGRKKEMILSGGENIYPAEIERALNQHPKIAESGVFGVPNGKWGEVGYAVICPKTGETITEKEVIDFLRDKIARFKIPKYISFSEALPKSAAGKIAKFVLKESYISKMDS